MPFQSKWSVLAIQSCPTLCNPMDCSPLGSPVHGILQARILKWVVISFARVSLWPRDWVRISCLIPGKGIGYPRQCSWVSLVAQMVKIPSVVQETWVQSLGWEEPLKEDMATHSDILAWKIPMDRGAWRAIVHGVAKSRTQLSDWTELCLVAQSCPTLCNPMDYSPPGSSVHGDFPGKNTGVGSHAFLQGIFPSQGSNPGLPHCRHFLYCLSHQGSPYTYIPSI